MYIHGKGVCLSHIRYAVFHEIFYSRSTTNHEKKRGKTGDSPNYLGEIDEGVDGE
jgi:hypothetical protein